MKTFVRFSIVCALTLAGCKKSGTPDPKIASGALNVTNAVIGGSTLTFTTNNSIISSNNTLGLNAASWFPLASGQISINLGVPAVAATVTTPAVPAVTYFSGTLPVNNSSNYSLFLTGASPSQIDTVLISESYTRTYSDSSFGVRFINLSLSPNPISVDIKGGANGSEVQSLSYKGYSRFIKHPALVSTPSYIFEFRDVVTGTLLSSYTLTTPYYHNVTLAFRGKAGAYGVILDNDY